MDGQTVDYHVYGAFDWLGTKSCLILVLCIMSSWVIIFHMCRIMLCFRWNVLPLKFCEHNVKLLSWMTGPSPL